VIYLLGYLASLGATAIVVWTPGYALDLLWLRLAGHPLRGLARWVLGLAAWQLVLFSLATVQLLTQPALAAVAALGLLAALLARLRSVEAPPVESKPPSGSQDATWAFLFSLPSILVLSLLFAVAADPTISQDAAVYHLTLPKLYLAHGGFRPVEMNVYSHWPLGVELLFGLALAGRDHVLAKLVHFGFGALLLYVLAVAGRAFLPAERGRVAGAVAGCALLANGVVLFSLPLANVDLAVAFYFAAAFFFALHATQSPRPDRRSLLIAGLAAGLLAGSKLNGIGGAAVVALVMAPRLLAGGRRAFAGLFVAPVALFWLPWLSKAWAETGNPVYPFLWDRFGGPDWSPRLAEQLRAWQWGIGMGRAPLDYLLLPWRVVAAGGRGYPHFDGSLGWHWLLLVPLALLVMRRERCVRLALVAAGLFFALWALGSQQLRLLLPALPLLAFAGAAALLDLATRRSSRLDGARLAALALACCAVLGWTARTELDNAFKHWGVDLDARFDASRAGAPSAVYDFLARQLPPRAKLLLLGTNRGFFLERPYLADSFFEASQISDWLAPAQRREDLLLRLRARGVTHLLVQNLDLGVAYPPTLRELLVDPAAVRWIYGGPGEPWAVGELR